MNVLSKLIDAIVIHEVFHYHHKYKKIKLTHLYFTDDLYIFSKGNLDSIAGIHNVIKVSIFFLGVAVE